MRGTIWPKEAWAETEVEILETPWHSKIGKRSSFIPLLGWTYSTPNSFFCYMIWHLKTGNVTSLCIFQDKAEWNEKGIMPKLIKNTHHCNFCSRKSVQAIKVDTINAQTIQDEHWDQTGKCDTQPYTVQKQLKSVAEVHLQRLVKLSANHYVECVVLK